MKKKIRIINEFTINTYFSYDFMVTSTLQPTATNKEDKTEFATKITKAIEKYTEDTISMLRIIRKRCNGESMRNNKDRKDIKHKMLKETLEKYNIEEEMQKERRIVMILDNFSTHKTKEIKEIAKILNITLIYLPPYSPQLNPIEQLWRKMKQIMKNI